MARPLYHCALRDDRCPPFPSHYVVQDCNFVHHKLARSGRTFLFTAPSAALMTSMPHQAVRSFLNGVSPSLSVQDLEAVPSSRLQLLYNVKVSDGPSLLLTLPPPAIMRLLRSEESAVESEVAVLKWLMGTVREVKDRTGHKEGECCSPVLLNGKSSKRSCGKGTSKTLLDYLPVLVRHGSMNGNVAIEYNLSRPPRGVAISALSRPLSRRERKVVSFQIGRLLRRISTQISPNRRFGPAADVLSVPPSAAQQRRLEGGLQASRGATTWPVAFQSMLESVLRDGEDLSVMISYATIRRHVNRFEHLLGVVKKPRLVVIDAGEDLNTLVMRPVQAKNCCQTRSENFKEKAISSRSTRKTPEKHDLFEQRTEESESSDDEYDEKDITNTKNDPGNGQVEVTGLRQWSNCIFGDPLMALPFIKHPSQDFWHGFDTSPESDTTLIEDEPNAHVRLLLYECYHAVVAVVREFCRPQTNGSETELIARKHLASVLRRLDELDDRGAPRRRRRPSGEMSPAKRPRQSEDESDD